MNKLYLNEKINHKSTEDTSSTSEENPITFNHLRKQERRHYYLDWRYILTLVFMFITLIIIIAYQDKCGQLISRLLFHDVITN